VARAAGAAGAAGATTLGKSAAKTTAATGAAATATTIYPAGETGDSGIDDDGDDDMAVTTGLGTGNNTDGDGKTRGSEKSNARGDAAAESGSNASPFVDTELDDDDDNDDDDDDVDGDSILDADAAANVNADDIIRSALGAASAASVDPSVSAAELAEARALREDVSLNESRDRHAQARAFLDKLRAAANGESARAAEVDAPRSGSRVHLVAAVGSSEPRAELTVERIAGASDFMVPGLGAISGRGTPGMISASAPPRTSTAQSLARDQQPGAHDHRDRRDLGDHPLEGPCVLLCAIATSSSRHCLDASHRVSAVHLMRLCARHVSDAVRLERVVPYLVELLADEAMLVRTAAVRALASVLASVRRFPPSDAGLFAEYIFPAMAGVMADREELPRVECARALPVMAVTARRFLEMAHAMRVKARKEALEEDQREDAAADAADLQDAAGDGGAGGGAAAGALSATTTAGSVANTSNVNVNVHTGDSSIPRDPYDEHLTTLDQTLTTHLQSLLLTPTPSPHSAHLTALSAAPGLASLLGRPQCADSLLPVLVTFLNHRSPRVRAAAFAAMAGVGGYLGRGAVAEYVLPLVLQGAGAPGKQIAASSSSSSSSGASSTTTGDDRSEQYYAQRQQQQQQQSVPTGSSSATPSAASMADSAATSLLNAAAGGAWDTREVEGAVAAVAVLIEMGVVSRSATVAAVAAVSPLMVHPCGWVRGAAVAAVAAAADRLGVVDTMVHVMPLIEDLLAVRGMVTVTEQTLLDTLKPPLTPAVYEAAVSQPWHRHLEEQQRRHASDGSDGQANRPQRDRAISTAVSVASGGPPSSSSADGAGGNARHRADTFAGAPGTVEQSRPLFEKLRKPKRRETFRADDAAARDNAALAREARERAAQNAASVGGGGGEQSAASASSSEPQTASASDAVTVPAPAVTDNLATATTVFAESTSMAGGSPSTESGPGTTAGNELGDPFPLRLYLKTLSLQDEQVLRAIEPHIRAAALARSRSSQSVSEGHEDFRDMESYARLGNMFTARKRAVPSGLGGGPRLDLDESARAGYV
jgi:hypothetical protein